MQRIARRRMLAVLSTVTLLSAFVYAQNTPSLEKKSQKPADSSPAAASSSSTEATETPQTPAATTPTKPETKATVTTDSTEKAASATPVAASPKTEQSTEPAASTKPVAATKPAPDSKSAPVTKAETAAQAEKPAPVAEPAAATKAIAAPKPTVDDPLALEVRQAIEAFQPITDTEVTELRQKVEAAVARLDQYLAASGANGADWRTYLQLDALHAHLKAGLRADRAALTHILSHFVANHQGLELAPFADVSRALRVYIDRLNARFIADQKADYRSRLEAIATGLESPTAETSRKLVDAVEALDRAGRAREIVQTLRARLAKPNLLVQVSSRFVGTGLGREVDDTAPLRDCILGTRITGTGHTRGKVEAHLLADPKRAAIETLMVGQNQSKTIGSNGPVFIYSNGLSQLHGRKVLYLTEQGLQTIPADVDVQTSTQITGVATTKKGCVDRLIKKIAWKKIPQEKANGERVAASHARRLFGNRLDAEAADSITQANQQYETKIRTPLRRFHAFPERLEFSSTADSLAITGLLSGANRFGSPTPPPAVGPEGDLVVRFHESVVNNVAAAVLGGRTLDQEQIDKMIIDLTGKPPERSPEDAKEPWSVTFADYNPITLLVDDTTVAVTVRGTRYTAGKRKLEAMNVTARYRLERDQGRLKATRVGDLEIFPPDFVPGRGQQLSTSQTVVRRMLQRRLGKLLHEEFIVEGLELKENFAALGPLPFSQLVVDDGWLLIGWRQPTSAQAASPTVAGPVAPNSDVKGHQATDSHLAGAYAPEMSVGVLAAD